MRSGLIRTFILILSLGFCFSAGADANWSKIRSDLFGLQAKFQDKKLTYRQKEELIPQLNGILSEAYSFKLQNQRNQERISVIVKTLAIASLYDPGRSSTDILGDDYAGNKKLYQNEIAKIKDPRQKKLVQAGFDLTEATYPNGVRYKDGKPTVKPPHLKK